MTDETPERTDLVLTTTREDGVLVIAVAGELDAFSAPSLEELAADAGADGAPITLDLARTTFIDSSGLRSLLALHAKLERNGVALTLRAPSDPVTRLLGITGLDTHFRFA